MHTVTDAAIHEVDAARWLLGDFTEVHAEVGHLSSLNIETEDTAVACLSFASGAVGTLEATTAAYPGYPRRVEITGSSIKRLNAETALPVQLITRADIEKSGTTTAAELLSKVSANAAALTGLQKALSSVQGTVQQQIAAAENLIALRHLGDIARDSSDPDSARTWYLRVLDADPARLDAAVTIVQVDRPGDHAVRPVGRRLDDARAHHAMSPVGHARPRLRLRSGSRARRYPDEGRVSDCRI